jgi:peptidoglycan/LPS O-acetylase OafA/YrhL
VNSTRKHLPALTGLRFFLALWVIFGHLIGKGNIYEPIVLKLPAAFQAIVRASYEAVPTFFVLSGFVLARNYASTQWNLTSFRKYLQARVARIYPVYFLSLLIVVPFIIKAKDQPKDWLVAMHLTLTQGWFAGHYTAGWNTPAWSLSCEMFFYLIFPLAVIPAKNRGWKGILAIAALATVMTQAMWLIGISDNIKPIIHLSDFVIGIAASRAFDLLANRTTGTWPYRTGIVGSAVIFATAQFLPDHLSMNTLLRPMNALLLIGLAFGQGRLARILSTKPIVYLGKASYAMYILHIPILWWAVSWPDFAVRYLYVPFVIAISCVVYTLIEEPANQFLRARKENRNRTEWALRQAA